ncbi:Oidioi.mRNA.OKI2018_I69.PAR.g8590.t1.cds [Oikopleura dioica]|uniref:Oidioi.mRNA.OKI2018_I69.PAR.g8590.t1.cds n=1 Tax=Oikopleura dioica TaxID=34765 RepID=A0ABN7RHP0_OIKDI|nr:Oidioi.mRNA.OKI2018_I69.PAR.g8590.t1.cds [Oikopleura dioica]
MRVLNFFIVVGQVQASFFSHDESGHATFIHVFKDLVKAKEQRGEKISYPMLKKALSEIPAIIKRSTVDDDLIPF